MPGSKKAGEQCVLNGNVSSSDDVLAEFTRPNLGRSDSTHLTCRCYGENCTERLLYSYSILPTPIVRESVVTMETGSVLVTPTAVSFLMTPNNILSSHSNS